LSGIDERRFFVELGVMKWRVIKGRTAERRPYGGGMLRKITRLRGGYDKKLKKSAKKIKKISKKA